MKLCTGAPLPGPFPDGYEKGYGLTETSVQPDAVKSESMRRWVFASTR